mmetsp:Transcript_5295/g.10801  ORF Transcript_5295/g.10801 Transcript_5295/m.10801 type:complete len:302 (-) Transcript_5295:304-1209(-)|eukprot:CAMPEP_0118937918 /NCGR_PEP_ID=MMETSP1169-20130426/24196_1 /TAXON_ID=36882 /ORGANISM="Pyramimonas obovata, Strain CCMP722" /LENGTH=301 /DNA_ID=CAMNT_0006881691 /DNA_START=54 /DNA_END=959 /DNA_ORIENTATION=+
MDDLEGVEVGGEDLSSTQLLLRWGVLVTLCVAGYVYLNYRTVNASSSAPRGGNKLGHGDGTGPSYRRDVKEGAGLSTSGASSTSSVTSSSSQSKSRLFGQKDGGRDAALRQGREAAIARLQEEHDAKVAAAKKAEEEKAEAQREAAKKAAEEKAAKAQAAREAAEQERQKSAALMEEMRRRKEEQLARAEQETNESAVRREEALKAARDERAQKFENEAGVLAVYAKRVEDGDKRVHLSPIGAASSVGDVRVAIQEAMDIPVKKQTLVVNGQILKNDAAALVDFLRPKTTEVCIMVLQQAS